MAVTTEYLEQEVAMLERRYLETQNTYSQLQQEISRSQAMLQSISGALTAMRQVLGVHKEQVPNPAEPPQEPTGQQDI